MRGHRIDEVLPPDKWRASNKQIRTYLKKHKLKNTKPNKKKAAAALKKAHEKAIHPAGKDISFQEAASEWQIVYGVQRVDGVFTYVSTADNASPVQKNVYLLLVITLTCHQIASVDALILDDEVVTFSTTFNADGASGGATGKFADHVFMQVNLGSAGQAALSELITDSGGDWTSEHRQAGCAHVYLRLKYSDELFPHGLPSIHFQIQGKVCISWDPPNYPAGFSRNPAQILWDLIRDSTFGGNRGITFTGVAMSLASDPFTGGSTITDEALNICAAAVNLAAGGTEPAYLCDITFNVTESINGMISKILSSFAGKLVHFGLTQHLGYWITILGPKYRTPVLALTINDMLSDVQIDTVDSLSEYFGKIGGTHVDNNKNWEETDFPPVIWPTRVTGGLANPYYDREDISLPCTLSSSMAQRLAKLEMYQRKYGLTISFRTWLKHYKYAPGDNITLTLSDLGWSSKVFEIQTMQLILESDQNGNDTLTLEVTAKENPSLIYNWDETTEERAVAAMPSLNYPTPTVSADTDPTAFTATSGNTTYIQQADGSIIPRVLLAWTAPTDALVTIGGSIQIEMKESADSTWSRVDEVPGSQESTYILDVKVGNEYDFRIRGQQTGGLVGAWVTVTNHEVAGKSDAPGDPTNLTLTYDPALSRLSWDGVSDADLRGYIVKVTTTGAVYAAADVLTSDLMATFYDYHVDPLVVYTFYVAAVNNSGVESVTPASLTFGTAPSGSSGSAMGVLGLTYP